MQLTAYRCSLPGLTGFTAPHCMRPGHFQGLDLFLAEKERFEPSVPLVTVHAISSRAPSASRSSLHKRLHPNSFALQPCQHPKGLKTGLIKMAEEEGFEPPVPVSKDNRFRVGPVTTTSVLLLTSGLKKFFENLPGLIRHNSGYNLRFMVNSQLKGLHH